MLIELDIHEMWYLLERCLNGSHLRSDTITRFVDEFYNKLSEHERICLFEWAVRLGYAWNRNARHFVPSSSCCGSDIVFMKRYHPLNQYRVYTKYNRKKHRHRVFKMNGEYYIDSHTRIDPEYIVKVEHIDLSEEWNEHIVECVDYDTNIIE